MTERIIKLKRPTLEHIAAQRNLTIEEISELVKKLGIEGLNKKQIYGKLMDGYGVPGCYVSGEPEGEPKKMGKNAARKKSIRRYHAVH